MQLKVNLLWLLLACCCCFWSSCKVAGLSTTWKNPDLPLPLSKSSRILVISILKDSGLAIRDSIELQVAKSINRVGYQAVSSLQRYGREGLSLRTDEEAYRALRTAGTDAVVTIALINTGRDANNSPYRGNSLQADYYYHRITSYSNIVENVADQEKEATATAYWEMIVFDLHTLTPVVVMRSKSYYVSSALDMYEDLPALMMARLEKEKVVIPAR